MNLQCNNLFQQLHVPTEQEAPSDRRVSKRHKPSPCHGPRVFNKGRQPAKLAGYFTRTRRLFHANSPPTLKINNPIFFQYHEKHLPWIGEVFFKKKKMLPEISVISARRPSISSIDRSLAEQPGIFSKPWLLGAKAAQRVCVNISTRSRGHV